MKKTKRKKVKVVSSSSSDDKRMQMRRRRKRSTKSIERMLTSLNPGKQKHNQKCLEEEEDGNLRKHYKVIFGMGPSTSSDWKGK